ncbi:hypothetical protein LAZ67_21001785 [Cordylochernes scorpioides]|uniref:Uncharacterized protein n=1 Tax=Cordylochernes scorpioides TaxID=51811 RepID=A0ABY6LND1_9ARAC|nr:hypothetical protein LAZ67_21001785 [Cordylochernes scorpioides]
MKRELRQRFRKEYLCLFVQKGKEDRLANGKNRGIESRVARVKTTRGILMRTIQKIYLLEVTSEEDMALLHLCAHTKRVGVC